MKLFLITLFFILGAQKNLEKKIITLGKAKPLVVEVASDFKARNKGLMNRTELKKNTGMLFVFDKPQILSFWMKNTYIPLSIGYFDKNKVLKEIHQMKPQNMLERHQDLTSYPSKTNCIYALEVNQGWFKKNKIKPGQKFQFKN